MPQTEARNYDMFVEAERAKEVQKQELADALLARAEEIEGPISDAHLRMLVTSTVERILQKHHLRLTEAGRACIIELNNPGDLKESTVPEIAARILESAEPV